MHSGSTTLETKFIDAPKVWFCEHKYHLLARFVAAVKELSELHGQQIRAVIDGDPNFTRFEALLHCASQRKDLAKYALMAHADSHGC